MLGAVFFDLLPEALEVSGKIALPLTLSGLLLFFLVEKGLLVYHCHETGSCDVHRLTASRWLIIVGDGAHNFLDGVIIATAFLTGWQTGIVVTLAVIAHEIPQEIGDFSILLQSGLSRARALFWNIISGLGSLLGAIAVLVLADRVTGLTNVLLPIAAGGFLYIASADLIPELHREVRLQHSLAHLVTLALGIAVIALISRYLGV